MTVNRSRQPKQVVMMEAKKLKLERAQGFVFSCYVGAMSENDRDGVKIAYTRKIR